MTNNKLLLKIKRWFGYPSGAHTIAEWRRIDDEFKAKYPIRYFLLETYKKLSYAIKRPYIRMSDFIRYSTVMRLHVVNTGLERGYYDTCDRMLHCVMQLVVDHVEVDSAWQMYHSRKHKYTLWQRFCSNAFHTYRSREGGLEYLDWCIDLGKDAPEQSRCAGILKEIYLWWTVEYPKTEEQIEEIYLSIPTSGDLIFDDKLTEEEKKIKHEKFDQAQKLEDELTDKTREMLHKIIDIREYLWT